MNISAHLENIPCNLCGADDFIVIHESTLKESDFEGEKTRQYSLHAENNRRGRIVKCRKCGLVYMNPREREAEETYEDVVDTIYVESRKERYLTFENDLNKIEKYVPDRGRLLDVGCSTGFFLEVARKRGWSVEGLELSKWAVEYATRNGLSVYPMTMEEMRYQPGTFDCVTMFGLVEHIKDPSGFMGQASKILRKDGLLFIWTPNIASISAKLTGKRWWSLLRRHIYYFSPHTITRMLKKNGLEPVKIEPHTRIMNLSYVSHCLKPYSLIHTVCKFPLESRLLGNIVIPVRFGGQMGVFAVKK